MWSHFPHHPPPPSFRCSIPHRTLLTHSIDCVCDALMSCHLSAHPPTVFCCGLLATSFSFRSTLTFPVTRVWGCSRLPVDVV